MVDKLRAATLSTIFMQESTLHYYFLIIDIDSNKTL